MTDRFTRRNFSLRIASGLGLASIAFVESSGRDEVSHAADAIHQELDFTASPKRAYEALLDSKQFEQGAASGGCIRARL
jgi:hypothetical protein